MKYFLIAGEASGDMLGASLMKGILTEDPRAEFQYWGGHEMQSIAPGLLQHYREINIMGFVEVLLNIRTIKSNMQRCRNQILEFSPDVLILIDYPGFNLRMATFAKNNGIKTAYFIAPKIWAWNERRGYKLEKYVDLLLLIFPFEAQYFKKWKVNSVYIGNPLFEQIQTFHPDPDWKNKQGLSQKPCIALLPGSRKQEIKRMLPNMVLLAQEYPQFEFVIAGAPGLQEQDYAAFLQDNVKLVFGATREILAISEAAIVCSGTATLETAMMQVPQVCAYAAHPISYAIAMTFVKVKYISLVNLNLDREVIKELIQNDFNLINLKTELDAILPGGNRRKKMEKDYADLQALFQNKNAGQLAAIEIKKLISV